MIITRLTENAALIENTLRSCFDEGDPDLRVLLDAQQYSLFARAKRIRPTLVLEFCRLLGGRDEAALPFAAAVEMIHTYSLIHDDLPCMDDDDLRRGKPTCHKVYGEATAVLAGDALLTRAFGVLARNTAVSRETACEAVALLSRAAGDTGMIGGQVLDLAGEGKRLPLSLLEKLHQKKTGAMIVVSAELGCLAAGALPHDPIVSRARCFAQRIGLAFQIIDDVLDATAKTEVLGKTALSDRRAEKTTFLSYYTPEGAMALARDLTKLAKEELEAVPGADVLLALADHLTERAY